jgi:glycerate-2-kinase
MEQTPENAARAIFDAALKAVDPYSAVSSRSEDIRSKYMSGKYKRLHVIGAGKASAVMARAAGDSLGDIIDKGIVITKHGHSGDFRPGTIRVIEAGHPVPDENGRRGTEEILKLAEAADEDTMILCLLSGGGSALLVSPLPEIGMAEKQEITDVLLRAGADINELNSVRKHLSAVKGGWLAAKARPARVVSLIISDVMGDRLDVIASGPTAPDPSTYEDAIRVLEKYSVTSPQKAISLLRKGLAGQVQETPKPNDAAFDRVDNIIVGSNAAALEAAREMAVRLGFHSTILTNTLGGEAREAANRLSSETARVAERPACLISGGETTVTVKGRGKGGRNTELALAFAITAEGHSGITLLSAGTDGTDGPTDAAGAIVNGNTAANARRAGLDPLGYLNENDSYGFFKKTGDLLITGPTGTNVMDIQIILLI